MDGQLLAPMGSASGHVSDSWGAQLRAVVLGGHRVIIVAQKNPFTVWQNTEFSLQTIPSVCLRVSHTNSELIGQLHNMYLYILLAERRWHYGLISVVGRDMSACAVEHFQRCLPFHPKNYTNLICKYLEKATATKWVISAMITKSTRFFCHLSTTRNNFQLKCQLETKIKTN